MFKQRIVLLIIICTIIRLVLAAFIEFGNDEVYYYTYALHLQSNYFDHPPGVAWLIKIFTANLLLQGEMFVRLGSVVCAAIATWLVYKTGMLVRNERTGWFAAILYNTSIYSSIIAGTFILPDSPQVVFWLAGIYTALKLVLAYNNNGKATYGQWLLFGVMCGLCIMCKVHGAFLWTGLGLYMMFYNRKMFLHPGFYLAAIITAVIISPIIFWNIQNNFITWRYHSQRVEVHTFKLNTDGFIQAFFGQIFYNNPLNVVITVASLFCLRKNSLLDVRVKRLLLLCGLPIVLFVTGIALFRDVLPHWSGPGFLTLSFIAAAFLDERIKDHVKSVYRTLLKSTAIFMLILATGALILINQYPGTLGSEDIKKHGDGDFTLDLSGWQQFGEQFARWQKEAEAGEQIPAALHIVCNKWFPASHIEYYVARPANNYVIGVGEMNDLHQYVWLNHYRGVLNPGDDALCIIPSNYWQDVNTAYGNYFQSATLLHTFTGTRGGTITRYFAVYLLKGYKANDEARGYKVE